MKNKTPEEVLNKLKEDIMAFSKKYDVVVVKNNIAVAQGRISYFQILKLDIQGYIKNDDTNWKIIQEAPVWEQ